MNLTSQSTSTTFHLIFQRATLIQPDFDISSLIWYRLYWFANRAVPQACAAMMTDSSCFLNNFSCFRNDWNRARTAWTRPRLLSYAMSPTRMTWDDRKRSNVNIDAHASYAPEWMATFPVWRTSQLTKCSHQCPTHHSRTYQLRTTRAQILTGSTRLFVSMPSVPSRVYCLESVSRVASCSKRPWRPSTTTWTLLAFERLRSWNLCIYNLSSFPHEIVYITAINLWDLQINQPANSHLNGQANWPFNLV